MRYRILLALTVTASLGFAAAYAASFGTSKPDYRTVLFDINASGGSNIVDLYNPNKTAVDDDNGNGTAFVDFGEMMSDVAQFQNKIVDDINQPISGQFRDNLLRHYTDMDAVNLFQLTGTVEVPEPTGIGLAMLGISALFLRGRSRIPRPAA